MQHQLAEERLAAAEAEFSGRYREFLSGRGTLYFLLASVRRCTHAKLAMQTDLRERATTCEEFWRRSYEIERINQFRYDAGKVGIGELSMSKVLMFTAHLDWLGARGQGAEGRSALPLPNASDEDEAKQFVRDRRAALSAEPARVAQERVMAAEDFVDSRFKEFFAGRFTLTYGLQGSAWRAEAEEAVARTPQERLNAWDRHWQRVWHTEQIMQARYDKELILDQDLIQAREYQLEAELKWLQMRDAVERK
jgi:hypothetical protein